MATLATLLLGFLLLTPPTTWCVVSASMLTGALIARRTPAERGGDEPLLLQPIQSETRSAQDDIIDLLLAGHGSRAGDWLWTIDQDSRLSGDLDRLATSAGLNSEALAGAELATLLRDDPACRAMMRAMAERQPFHDQIVEVYSPAASGIWWRLSGKPVVDGRGDFVGYRGIGSDITALREAQARIARLATHDALTGLANRETFQLHAARACAAASTDAVAALLILDLDGFKQVNDDFGHAVGDELLATVAATLTRVVPDDALVARLGGDEFAILCAPGTVAAAERLAVALVRAMSAPFVLGEHQATIGMSIGIAVAPADATLPRELVRKADLALYRAKHAGRGCHVVFQEAFERERQERLRLEADIALALERHELTLHYQPLLALAEGRIAACEALIRWLSPTRGNVPPATFIPAAESGGLIVAIGRFVLARACRDAASWPLPATVAVNISPQHLRSPDFRSDIASALKASGLPPSRLEIEITEGVFLDRSSAAIESLTWLRECGIKVALDDFGTGFSSLNYLVDFPVDKIKIDRSFVAGLANSRQNRAVIDSILMLARDLGIRVVAEGVETPEQALALKLRRCDDLQGYLISRPRPADDIAALLVGLPEILRDRVPALLESSLAAALILKRTA